MPEFAGDLTTELERKVAWLRAMCLIETVSYLILFAFWVSGNDIGTKVFGSVHGMVFLGFAAMVIGVYRPMEWTIPFVVVAICTGPFGALVVYERIRRRGVPIHLRGSRSSGASGSTA